METREYTKPAEKSRGEYEESLLQQGKEYMESATAVDLLVFDRIEKTEKALKRFEAIPGYRDADDCAKVCRERLERWNTIRESMWQERRLEKEQKRLRLEEKKKKRIRNLKTAAKITGIALGALLIVVILAITLILPPIYYRSAEKLEARGELAEACTLYQEIPRYKDAEERAEDLRYRLIAQAEVDDIIYFGKYEQDNIRLNGKEVLEWKVLCVEDGKVLVATKYVVDCCVYYTGDGEATWENSDLRQWMNQDFFNSAFSAEEQSRIATTTVIAEENPKHDTPQGKDTLDKIFAPSLREFDAYLALRDWDGSAPTRYAAKKNLFYVDGTSRWWLRTTGSKEDRVAFTWGPFGESDGIYGGKTSIGVRPLMWIEMDP